ncbi:MAG TPA: Arm DNA-binding domain-containing protein, partial [Hyphomonadaceae bacterium]|nr:Arm DNA-binding domain-containing protein [Hyphomonadaceae bacterium]
MKLIKRNIDVLPKPAKERVIYDDELSGFALRVSTEGRKVFIAHYRVGGGRSGRQRKVTIGVYGTITADEART